MEVVIEDTGPCRKVLKFNVTSDEVTNEFDQALNQFKRFASLPGFRQGKAPEAMVLKKHRKDILKEVEEKIVPRYCRQALDENKLSVANIVSYPEVAIKKGEALSFDLTVDIEPTFELPDFKSIEIKVEETEITDEAVDERIGQILERHATFDDVKGQPAKASDLVEITFSSTCEGQPLEEFDPSAKGLGSGEEFSLVAGEAAFIPELGEALVGMSIDETKEDLSVTFDANFAAEKLREKACLFTFTVTAIKERKMPELTEEILQENGAESEDELRGKLKEQALKEAESAEERRQKDEVVKWLIENVEMEVPDSVVSAEAQNMVYSMVNEELRRGGTDDSIRENRDKIYDVARENALKTVKVNYLTAKIASENELQVSKEEIEQQKEIYTMFYHVPKKDLDDEKVALSILQQKTTSFLLEQITITK